MIKKDPIMIIGGGPSGMMAAISAKMHHPKNDVLLIERNKKLGIKLSLTGGGRCNVTSKMDKDDLVAYIPKNAKFLYSTFNQYDAYDIIDFFNSHHCPLKEEDHFRMFPKSNQSSDIIETLEKKLRQLGVEIIFEQLVTNVDYIKKVIVTNQKTYHYQSLIIATGGVTLPNTGSDGTGYELAKKADHTITKLLPAEVPLVSNDSVIQSKELQGLSFKDVSLSVYNQKGKIVKTLTHDLLITHFGLSGPLALRASYDIINLFEKNEKTVKITIDFLPKITLNHLESLTEEDLKTTLKQQQVPKRLLDYLKTNHDNVIKALKQFELTIHDTGGFKRAFVTNGGISLKEIDPKTMKSKLNPSLSFCGEIMDINAYTGGFNITSALATGFVAGKHALDF